MHMFIQLTLKRFFVRAACDEDSMLVRVDEPTRQHRNLAACYAIAVVQRAHLTV